MCEITTLRLRVASEGLLCARSLETRCETLLAGGEAHISISQPQARGDREHCEARNKRKGDAAGLSVADPREGWGGALMI